MRYLIIAAGLLICVSMNSAQAQNLRKAAKATKTLTDYFKSNDITGIWTYEGIDVQFKSSNLLKKAGGIAAANMIENKLDDQLASLGFEPGITTFEFNEDGSFSNRTGNRTLTGSWILDKEKGTITLKYLNHIPLKANISVSSQSISFLFESDAFLSIVSFIAGNSGIGILQSVGSVANSYDGMMIGMKLRKEK